jgi:predicted DNA-binding transcriptional regulator YafY
MTTKEIIYQAIKDRNVIQFSYDGQLRIVEPFTLGYHKDTNNLVLSAYRVGGYSKSQNDPPWRLYTVDDIRNLSVSDKHAESYRQGYNPRDSRMSSIICTC